MNGPRSPSRLASLLNEFSRRSGDPRQAEAGASADSPECLECRAGDYLVRLMPDPIDDSQLSIEIEVLALDLAELAPRTRALLLLHRFNESTRLMQAWQATIDDDDLLLIHQRQPIDGTGVGDLESAVAEGLEMAVLVHQLWMLAAPSAAPQLSSPLRAGDLTDTARSDPWLSA